MRRLLQASTLTLILILFICPVIELIHPNNSVFTTSVLAAPSTQSSQPPVPQDPTLFFKEVDTIYRTNLARRTHGLAPLRWNRELHLAARWFAEDAVIGRDQPYCGHTDSKDRSPGERFRFFGYKNPHAWGENVICGLTSPENAVKGWMGSDGHRQNMLHPEYREIGVGYYQRGSSGRGYIVQELSYDPNYAPVIIENEAPSVTETTVNLYIYTVTGAEGLQGMGPAVEMMVANDPDFTDAVWEPYQVEKAWTLETGEGWRSVYVKTRDAQGRTSTVFDTVYLGETLPIETLNIEQASSYRPRLALESLDTSGWPQVQLSLNWQGDDSDTTFQDMAGTGERVSDVDAVSGNAYLLRAGEEMGRARYWTTAFHKEVPLVAYFRVKTSDVTSADKLLDVWIDGGGVQYGPLTLHGTDFAEANRYQEFALPFQFHENANDPYLTFRFEHSGKNDIYLDTLSVFTESMPVAEELEWQVLGGYHRSRGIWARFVQADGAFSPPTDLEIFGANADINVPPPIVTVTPIPPGPPPITDPVLNNHLYLPVISNQ